MGRKAVVLDIASDFNRGDAIMQKAYWMMLSRIGVNEVSGIGIYGFNEGNLANDHYDESNVYYSSILHGLRKTYNLSPKSSKTKLKNLLSLINVWALILFPSFIFGEQKKQYKKVLELVVEADLVIWNGRNFRNRKGMGELYDLLCFVYLPVLVLLRTKKPMIFYGVSVWPLKLLLSRLVVRQILKSNRIDVWSRENATKDVLQNYGIDSRRCMDLSFPVLQDIVNSRKYNTERDIEYSLTLTDWIEDGLFYRSNYINVIASFINHNASIEKPIYVLPQVYPEWESYNEILDEILNKVLDDRFVVQLNQKLTHGELCDYYFRSNIVVTTRMHGAIFAAWCGCKVVSIAYDAGSKWHILKDLNCFQTVIEYKNLSDSVLKKAIKKAEKQETIDQQYIMNSIQNDLKAINRFW